MKKFSYLLLLMLCSSMVKASDGNVGDLIASSYLETQNKMIKDFQGDGFEISFENESIAKSVGINDGSLTSFITISGKRSILFKQKDFNPYGQDVFVFSCKAPDSNVRVFIQTRYASSDNIAPWFIQFTPYIFTLEAGLVRRLYDFENEYFYGDDYFSRRIIDDEKLIIKYPFYTNDKIIERLFESKLCVANND